MNYLDFKQWINKKYIMPRFIKKRVQVLKNENISIISSNCIGGVISHDFGLEFKSPTVDLYFDAINYIKFVNKLGYYLSCELLFNKNHSSGYPICTLDDTIIHFVHYKSFEQCLEKWNKRKVRINFDNILLIFTNQNGCTDELVERFSKLSYNKILFSSKEYPQYDFCYFIPQTKKQKIENKNPIDELFLFKGYTGKRKYEDYFNLIDYLKK